MSRPRLHQVLNELFNLKENSLLAECLLHPDYSEFMQRHGITIPAKDFVQSFVHTSFTHEFQIPNQELLEFLGDAVLQFILTDELFVKFPGGKEGQLSKLRSAIVNEKSLSIMARGLKLNELILVGKGEFQKKLFEQDAVLADTFEALLAQIYQFHGIEFTRTLFSKWLDLFIPKAFDENFLDQFDAKSKLQERVLAKYKKLPRYSSVEKGSEFEVTLWINDKAVSHGVYSSKKAGEKDLAHNELKKENI